jgi:hypothetical protein
VQKEKKHLLSCQSGIQETKYNSMNGYYFLVKKPVLGSTKGYLSHVLDLNSQENVFRKT